MKILPAMILAALFAYANFGHAGEPIDPVLERLAKVERFAFGGTGYAGVTSRGEKDFRIIAARASAETDFEELLRIGNPQAKAYALVGIRAIKPAIFQQLSRSLHDSTEEIVVQSGCIVYHQAFAAILKRIGANEFSIYASIKPTSPEPAVAP